MTIQSKKKVLYVLAALQIVSVSSLVSIFLMLNTIGDNTYQSGYQNIIYAVSLILYALTAFFLRQWKPKNTFVISSVFRGLVISSALSAGIIISMLLFIKMPIDRISSMWEPMFLPLYYLYAFLNILDSSFAMQFHVWNLNPLNTESIILYIGFILSYQALFAVLPLALGIIAYVRTRRST